MITIAIVVIVIIILLLLLWPKKKQKIGNVELPTINFTFPPWNTQQLPPIDIGDTTDYPPSGSCGCGGAGLLPDYQRLLDAYTTGLGDLIDKQFDLIMENLPAFYKQFVNLATDPIRNY